jgi:hypothetical protein
MLQGAWCMVGISVAGFWLLVEEDAWCNHLRYHLHFVSVVKESFGGQRVQVAGWKKFVCNES